MLHEVLLALSGHPSPLFGDDGSSSIPHKPLLSNSEQALLQNLGSLSQLHRKLKSHSERIASTHASIICRAVGNSIQQDHLAQFQRKILDVESRILKRDASMVGAYEIVPLASIVSEFDEWHRRMEWYWDVACFLLPPQDRSSSRISLTCSGSKIIDKLRSEAQTGYPSIEQAAKDLSSVAETVWLRQLAAWLIYGKLPAFAAQDFFIQAEDSDPPSFKKQKHLLPTFVPPSTSNAILSIGRSVHHVEHYRRQSHVVNIPEVASNEAELADVHLRQLSSLALPILPWQFSKAIAEIRLSLSRNVLQHLLPQSLTTKALACLRNFFLLDRGEFSIALITEAEHRLQTRQQSIGRLLQQDPVKAFRGLTIKDAELSQTLAQTWKALLIQGEGDDDEVLDFAQEHVRLSIPTANDSRPSTADGGGGAISEISTVSFNNLLFPTPTKLNLNIAPPLSLFLSRQELDTYSAIHAYLIAIRRGHLKLSDLWRRSPARREQAGGATRPAWLVERIHRRSVEMRKVWATCSAAIFLLAETAAFFEGEIVRGSCYHFRQWIDRPPVEDEYGDVAASTEATSDVNQTAQRDPETLASGHRIFLASLIHALLLTDLAYTRALRSLLGNVDQLIAFFGRLLDVQQKLDLERSAGMENTHTIEDEQRMALELDRARKKVDSDLKSVIQRLHQLGQDRVGSSKYHDLVSEERSTYEPWRGGAVDRLLMKLEFGRMVGGENSYGA